MDLPKLRGLSLFSGIGGDTLALSPYIETIAYCEKDKYCQSVLLSRMSDGLLSNAPIWDNIRSLSSDTLPEGIDIIYGGSPCQQLSTHNPMGKGLAGKDSILFFELTRLVNEIRPKFVFLENVHGIVGKSLKEVCTTFTQLGYCFEWTVIPATGVGASHLRRRWFMLAVSNTDEN